ncbi:VOC family protein [Enterovirga aerilata]|nr:VOC family protein [Enterovirga sp. DB1703]
MAAHEGEFTWYELMTTDLPAAQRFYTAAMGWEVQDVSRPEMAYILFSASGVPACGLMDVPEPGIPPGFFGYVATDDVERTTEKARALGATIHKEPTDVPGVGSFAVLSDPQGAAFGLHQWSDAATAPGPALMSPGRMSWHEIMTTDWEAAFGFYGELFGWQKSDAIDMGPMGTYQLFTGPGGGDAVGGMFNKPPQIPQPFWLYYVAVPAIAPAVERIRAGGGQIINGPMEVPGGAWIVQGIDPQGAMFALVGMRP